MTLREQALSTGKYWTQAWNPLIGCRAKRISPGCRNCWAATMCYRAACSGRSPFDEVVDESGWWNGETRVRAKVLAEPSTWKKRRRVVAVNWLGDVALHSAKNQLLTIEALRPALCMNTALVLTKNVRGLVHGWALLEKCWIGATVTCQSDIGDTDYGLADMTTDHSARGWYSVEPMLGPLKLPPETYRYVHAIVVGCETGPGAVAMDPQWVLDLARQCREQNIPLFAKQTSDGTRQIRGLTFDDLPWIDAA